MKFKMGKKTNIRRLLAIVAMDVEEKSILNALGPYEVVAISRPLGINAKVFKRNGKELILVKSGIGPVNAGLTTALIADKFDLDGVLLFGVAGAITSDLEIGHLVVATRVVQHDSIYSGEAGVQLMAPGEPFVSVNENERDNPVFETDPEFRNWLTKTLHNMPEIKFSEGTLLSGSEFVGSGLRKREIAANQPDALAVEMEAAGIAVVVRKLNLPFAALKTVADRLNPDESVSTDYNQFVHSAAENAGQIMHMVWEIWAREK